VTVPAGKGAVILELWDSCGQSAFATSPARWRWVQAPKQGTSKP